MNMILQELLKTASAKAETIWETVCGIWAFLMRQPVQKREEVFALFLREIVLDELEIEKPDVYFQRMVENITQDIDRLAERILRNLIQKNVTEEQFYQNLWEKNCDMTLLPDETAQIAFLLRLWADPRIPYYQIGMGCTMEDEEFRAIRKTISPALKKANYILTVPFPQKTQLASLLMDLADGIADRREKAVFWANVIARIRSLQKARSMAEREEGQQGKKQD